MDDDGMAASYARDTQRYRLNGELLEAIDDFMTNPLTSLSLSASEALDNAVIELRRENDAIVRRYN